MNRSHFDEIRVFVEVARQGGFRAAAQRLQQAPASISDAVRRLEERLGIRLFERSTRTVALTDIGARFFQRSLAAVTDLEVAIRDIEEQKDEVTGTLRLSAPYSAGPFFLDDLVARFALTYPAVSIELIYDDQTVDLLTSGVDAVVRSSTMLEPDTYAVPVGPEITMAIVAAPDYLARKGTPEHPRDIARHDAICYAFGLGGPSAPWSFNGTTSPYVIQPQPRVIANDMRSLVHYAQAGLGLAYMYREIAAPHFDEGSVVDVLGTYLSPLPRYSLNYRTKRFMPRRLRALLDMAKMELEPPPSA